MVLNTKKKILFWGPYTGHVGTIKAQLNSASALKEYGDYEVVLVRTHSEFVGHEEILSHQGIRILDLGLSRMFPGLEKSSRFARRPYMLVSAIFGFVPLILALRREKPDAVVINLIAVPALVAMIVSRVSALRIVSIQGYPHFLGIEGDAVPLWKAIENRIRKFLWNRFFPRADMVLTMTPRTREKLISNTRLNENKVYVLENPVIDDAVLSALGSPSPHEWFHGADPVLIGVGRLTKQKGFDILIEAGSILRSRGVNAKILIIGEGEDRIKLEEKIRQLDLADHVALPGHKPDPYPYMAHADLFVLSSRWEDPGHAIIEAAALGTPIVTTDCPSGPSELVAHGAGGWVCKNGNPNDMADKIQEALAHPDPRKTKIAKEQSEKYTLQAHFSTLNRLLAKISKG